MATEIITAPVTAEQFLEMERNAPGDVHLELIEGEIREYPAMTTRNPKHAEAITRIGQVLANWLDEQTDRIGTVAGGEARCRLAADPETIVGLDVAYFEGERHVHRPKEQKFYDGPPVLAVEVLSDSDTHEEVRQRIERFLDAGVRQVWQADPDFRTVTVFRPGAEPEFFAASEEIPGGLDLPGLRCRVARLFGPE